MLDFLVKQSQAAWEVHFSAFPQVEGMRGERVRATQRALRSLWQSNYTVCKKDEISDTSPKKLKKTLRPIQAFQCTHLGGFQPPNRSGSSAHHRYVGWIPGRSPVIIIQ